MNVSVVVFGMLRDHLPAGAEGNRAGVDVDDGATVTDAATALGIPPGAVFAILVDGEPARRTTILTEGTEVTLMPAFTGGCRQPTGSE